MKLVAQEGKGRCLFIVPLFRSNSPQSEIGMVSKLSTDCNETTWGCFDCVSRSEISYWNHVARVFCETAGILISCRWEFVRGTLCHIVEPGTSANNCLRAAAIRKMGKLAVLRKTYTLRCWALIDILFICSS